VGYDLRAHDSGTEGLTLSPIGAVESFGVEVCDPYRDLVEFHRTRLFAVLWTAALQRFPGVGPGPADSQRSWR
jgi:hypothetical protein